MYNFYFFLYNYYGDIMFKYRRVLAFLLDILLVSLISMLLINNPKINPNYFVQEEYNNIIKEKMNNIKVEVTSDADQVINSMYNQLGQELYDGTKYSVYAMLIFLIVNTLYFTLFTYCNDGKTLGCAIFKLQIKKRNNKKAGIINLGMRSLFMGSCIITSSPILSIWMIIMPRLLNAKQAFLPLLYGSTLALIFEIVLLCVFFFNKKGMTIQDYLSNTKIFDTKR